MKLLYDILSLAPACPPLKKPRNGNMVINPSDRSISAEVRYSCKDGYVLSGQKNRICQENERWNGTRPSCRWPAKGGKMQDIYVVL